MKKVKALFSMILFIAVAWGLGFWLFLNKIDWNSKQGPLPKADGIVVLTGGAGRIEKALELLDQGNSTKLLISGVHPKVPAGTLQNRYAKGNDLFTCCVEIDYKAIDTVGNAVQTSAWVKQNHFKSLIIVTSQYHMPRAMVEFKYHLNETSLTPVSVQTDVSFGYLLKEYHKYLFSLLRGFRQ